MDALQSWWKRNGGGGGGDDAALRENAAWPLVDRATADILLHEDFAANLEVSDFCNASVDHATLVARAIVARLRCRSPKSVKLALSLAEMCVKNGTSCALRTFGSTREFMTVVADVATGKTAPFTSAIPGTEVPQAWLEVQERALEVIQELGQLMQDRTAYPGFYETYAGLTARGIIFPVRDAAPAAALAADPVAFGAQSSSRTEHRGAGTGMRAADIDKLEHDLSVLECKIQVADHLLGEGLHRDAEEILDVLDFLLQCKPRMCELIEASAQGLLSDTFLEACLQMNDRLCATVDSLESLPAGPSRKSESDDGAEDEVDLFAQFDDGNDNGALGPREASSATSDELASLPEPDPPAPQPRPTPVVVPALRAPRTASGSHASVGPQAAPAPQLPAAPADHGKSSGGKDYSGNPFDFFDSEYHDARGDDRDPDTAKSNSEEAPLVPQSAKSETEKTALLE